MTRVPFTGTIPTKGHETDAGWDLTLTEDRLLPPKTGRLLPVATRVNIPKNYYGQLTVRSSLAKKGIHGHIGIIDSGYTGTIKLPVHNTGWLPRRLRAVERVAQLILLPVEPVTWERTPALGDTPRGAGGFGSTGK